MELCELRERSLEVSIILREHLEHQLPRSHATIYLECRQRGIRANGRVGAEAKVKVGQGSISQGVQLFAIYKLHTAVRERNGKVL
eukprot:6208796-Pleurochrysis_carterae.AAC.1